MRLNRQGLGYIAQMQAPQTSLQFTPFLAQALASTHPPIAHTQPDACTRHHLAMLDAVWHCCASLGGSSDMSRP